MRIFAGLTKLMCCKGKRACFLPFYRFKRVFACFNHQSTIEIMEYSICPIVCRHPHLYLGGSVRIKYRFQYHNCTSQLTSVPRGTAMYKGYTWIFDKHFAYLYN